MKQPLYFTLSNFYTNGIFYNYLLQLTDMEPEWFKYPIRIQYASGNFPYQIWNGGYNTCYGQGAYYNDFVACFNQSLPNLRLNFANCRLIETDYYDTMGNNILQICNNGSNVIEIADLQLMEFIKNKYPEYQYICSKNLFLYQNASVELIDQLTESQQFVLISLPEQISFDVEFLKQLKHKNNIEITVNPRCPIFCTKYQFCHLSENAAQLNFSQQSICTCASRNNYFKSQKQIISIEELVEKYLPLGINNFQFDDFSFLNENNITANALFLISYFIKPEYQTKCMQNFLIQEDKKNA